MTFWDGDGVIRRWRMYLCVVVFRYQLLSSHRRYLNRTKYERIKCQLMTCCLFYTNKDISPFSSCRIIWIEFNFNASNIKLHFNDYYKFMIVAPASRGRNLHFWAHLRSAHTFWLTCLHCEFDIRNRHINLLAKNARTRPHMRAQCKWRTRKIQKYDLCSQFDFCQILCSIRSSGSSSRSPFGTATEWRVQCDDYTTDEIESTFPLSAAYDTSRFAWARRKH